MNFQTLLECQKPLFRNNNLVDLINNNMELLKKKLMKTININLIFSKNVNLNFHCDYEQISRAIF